MPSASLRAQRLCFSYSDRPLLDDVTFHLTPGWTGLVGANGCGKTTLLELLALVRRPAAGQVRLEPTGARVVLCPQRVDQPDDAIRALLAAHDGEARRLKGRLRLEDDGVERWPTLSPGERKRWQVAAALYRQPDVLLLDEPTNHLDAQATALAASSLERFAGIGVLVSHDRALLRRLTTATLRLRDGAARLWPLPYDTAREAWLEDERLTREARQVASDRLALEARRLDDVRRRHEASTRQRRAGARMKGPHDSDARTLAADYRAETAQRSHAAQLRRTARRAQAARAEAARLAVKDAPGRELSLRDEACPRPVVLSFCGDVPLPDGRVLLEGVAVQLGRGERVAVTGDNGAGKSTFLAALRAAAQLPPERVLWLPQELHADEARADLAALHAMPPEARGRVLQWVAALGVDPDAFLRSTAPSPGEARKLRLALGLGQRVWLAVLDEPENHLDLPSLERLEAALVAFPGALLVVTHDDALRSRLAATTWHLSQGHVRQG